MDIIIIYNIYNTLLVGGFNHLEKYESQWEGLSHIMEKLLKPSTRLFCFCFVNKWTTSVGIVPLDQLPGDIARHRHLRHRARGRVGPQKRLPGSQSKSHHLVTVEGYRLMNLVGISMAQMNIGPNYNQPF